MKFLPKHVVAIVACLSLASVLTPVGVLAATGQLVNVVDPVLSARKVRVGSAGTLQVETRPGVPGGARNVSHTFIQDFEPRGLLEVTSPARIGLSEISFTVTAGGAASTAPTIIEIVSFVRISGTAPCGGEGWGAGTLLRRVSVATDTTEQLTFDGPPLVVAPAASGKRQCVAVRLNQHVGSNYTDVGATVFTYS